jgi:hypothetical protein
MSGRVVHAARAVGTPRRIREAQRRGEDDVLRFVRRYGLPGYAHGLTRIEQHALRLAKDGDGHDPLIDKSYDPQLPGDPIAWILAHADTVRFVGALAAALDTPEELRCLFERRIVADNGREELRFVRAVRGRTRPKEGRLLVPDAKSRRATALTIIALSLHDNLGGVSRSIGIEGTRLVSLFQPNNLLDSIYWLLADEVTSEQIRACEECGHSLRRRMSG